MPESVKLEIVVDLDPLPGYGATTMILGNCGFSPAPLHRYMPAKREMIAFYTEKSAREQVEAILLSRIGHYNPRVLIDDRP